MQTQALEAPRVDLSELLDQDAVTAAYGDFGGLSLSIEKDTLERDLHAFLQAVWPLVEPTQPFVDNWHLRLLCEDLERAAEGHKDYQRLIFNVSPGTLKSLLITVVWPAWRWAKNPAVRVLTASYGSHLTIRDNIRVRDIITSPWFQARWKVKLVEDQNAKTRFNTDAGGWRIATSVGGVGTGEHPGLIIIDDPTTASQAQSEKERTEANEWFDRTISSRGITQKRLCVVVVMQRLHPDDLTGHLEKRGGWRIVRWPMRYEARRPKTEQDPEGFEPDPRDPRTVPGELFFPALIPEAKVRTLELDLGPGDAAAQLQQQPSRKAGTLFKRGDFKWLDAMPTNVVRRMRGWDTAGTQDGGDWTVGIKLAETADGMVIVEDIQRAQLNADGVDKLMLSVANSDGKDCPQREEKEGGSAGLAVVAARAKLLTGFDYKHVVVSGDKVTRAKPFRAQVEAGNVYLLRGRPNVEAYLDVLTAFPTGPHDDDVDGSSCSFNALVMEPKKVKVRATW